jgi:hypothetical protein
VSNKRLNGWLLKPISYTIKSLTINIKPLRSFIKKQIIVLKGAKSFKYNKCINIK